MCIPFSLLSRWRSGLSTIPRRSNCDPLRSPSFPRYPPTVPSRCGSQICALFSQHGVAWEIRCSMICSYEYAMTFQCRLLGLCWAWSLPQLLLSRSQQLSRGETTPCAFGMSISGTGSRLAVTAQQPVVLRGRWGLLLSRLSEDLPQPNAHSLSGFWQDPCRL